jgi:hypothetical protein
MKVIAIVVLVAACGKGDESKSKAKEKPAKPEAPLQLKKLQDKLTDYNIRKTGFPKGKGGPTPPNKCCDGPDHKCPILEAQQWFADPIWGELEFHIDEPTHFQYGYESDGTTVKLTAIGDPDCTGHAVTYTNQGHLEGSNAAFEMSGP